MRWIEPGGFLMGFPPVNELRSEVDIPQHKVAVRFGFWLADTTCTQALWQSVMRSNPSFVTDDPNKPVEQVSWDDVQGFFESLESQENLYARLPTEAQWEYACLAGAPIIKSLNGIVESNGSNFNLGYDFSDRIVQKNTTVPVKSFAPNAWGLYQMYGNVNEWCQDHPRPYSKRTATDPIGESHIGINEFAVRGGSWINLAGMLKYGVRDLARRGHRADDLGFRFVLHANKRGVRRLMREPVAAGFWQTSS
jgi:formylglycine-generating enzyme required for sulfatase activity